jgi:hypothetical protein
MNNIQDRDHRQFILWNMGEAVWIRSLINYQKFKQMTDV